jgi:conjugal transfer pilus assembly protein TraU
MRSFLPLGALLLAAFPASLQARDYGPGKCTGQFVNPITDICWSCLFPISVGGLEIWPSNRPDPDNPDLPVCLCGLRPGIAMGFWEPVRLADVSMKPWCFVNLGGMKLDPGFDIGFRSISGPSAVGGASQYYSSWHVHWYAYPLIYNPRLLCDCR